jgi:PAS domain-containing protein
MSMETAHSLLRRQLKRCFGADFTPPPEWREFVGAIDEAYRAFDADRGMLERSLELSSQELMHASAEMRAVFQAIPDLLIRLDQHGAVLDCKFGALSEDAAFSPLELAAGHITENFRAAVKRVGASRRRETLVYTLARGGEELSFEARLVPVLQDQVVAFVRDMTAPKKSDALRAGQNLILEMIVDGVPLERTLLALAHLFESQVSGMLCSIRRRACRRNLSPRPGAFRWARAWAGAAPPPIAGKPWSPPICTRTRCGPSFVLSPTRTACARAGPLRSSPIRIPCSERSRCTSASPAPPTRSNGR